MFPKLATAILIAALSLCGTVFAQIPTTPTVTSSEPAATDLELTVQSCQRADGEDAIVACQQLLDILPPTNKTSRANAYNNMGVVHTRGGRHAQAAEMYKKALKENPVDPVFHYGLGLAYANDKQLKKALKALKMALKLRPNEADYHFATGVVHANLGENAKAEEHLKQAVTLWDNLLASDPGYFDTHPGLKKSYDTAKSFLPAL